ncbi:MAG: SH3 beta-barrel fold-containing protein [Sulfurovum sp.]|nr:SH3 beta-barrel fold-containing protein [Sulfurovum sp.]
MKQLPRYKALKIIHDTHGRIFSAKFIKKDGTARTMVARIGVSKHLKGGTNGASAKNNLVTVYDMKKGGYRMINIKTLLTLKVGGELYEVV